jgi:signal transduction histidine kinase
MMTDQQITVRLTQIADNILSGYPRGECADVPVPRDPQLQLLREKVCELERQYRQARGFVIDLSHGRLDATPPRHNTFADPYKQLHSALSHLTWQIMQIADGDYDQRVSFSGDFSDAMNRMTAALRERQELSRQLARSNATKDRLFSIIAHDLRNPFSALVSLSGLLVSELEEGPGDDALQHARIMRDSAIEGYGLLVNLLDWSRQQSGKIVFSPRPFDPSYALDYNISIARLSAESKGIAIEMDDRETFTIFSDETIFGTVFRNLLSNAVKFTREGGHIRVSIARVPGFHHFSVQDDGVGIPAEKLEHLFDGEAASTSGTKSEAGTGLGLILCRDFAHMLGGEIWAESKVGEGSTFTFSIPDREGDSND